MLSVVENREHACRWGRCRQAFSTNQAYIEHVLSHLHAAKPERRSDIPILSHLDKGWCHIELIRTADLDVQKAKCSEYLPSSLPSPPASSTSSPPSAFPSPALAKGSQILRVTERLGDRYLTEGTHSPPSTPMKNAVEPSFASLSSPADSHLYSPTIPKSPDLNQMISDAIYSQEVSATNSDPSPSGSSSSSRESVVQHLTQIHSSQPGDASPVAKPGNINRSQTQSASFTITHAQNATHQSAQNRRQTWYQTFPRAPKSSRAKRMFAVVSPSPRTGQALQLLSQVPLSPPDAPSPLPQSSSSGMSSTPEWSQISIEAVVHSQEFPYQTQPPYESQPNV